VTILSYPDFKIAGTETQETPDCINSDSLAMIGKIPEVGVPVSSLMAGFHLRQDGTDAAHVKLLADAAGSVDLPSILVQKHGLRIIDGMHRLEVAKLRSEWSIRARIVDCTDEEALVLAVKSNTLHGLPLTRADRISSTKRILIAHPDWSDRAVAGITGLSAKSIASLRNSSTGDMQFDGKRLGRDGKRRPVMAGEGRRRAAEYMRAHPGASLREVSRETDVSLGTVHDVRERLRQETDQPPPVALEPTERSLCPAEPQWRPGRQAGNRPAAVTAVSLPVKSIHQGTGARNASRLVWPAVSAKLAGDPALRYTEGGRAFLRWMAAHALQADEWREFIDAIPRYWLEDVSRVAVGMSEEWRQFADRLSARIEAAG
jgi:hypothetical protein